MNVITLASRKGGVGKSTLTAHLAAFAHLVGYRTMVVDADPQGSLTLWHSIRARHLRGGSDGLTLQNAAQGVNRILASAQLNGYRWVFVDTAPTTWLVVKEAIRAATLVLIPVRPGFFDLAAVRETVATARELGKPYAVVINAAPVKREDKESPAVALSRAQFDALAIPVWSARSASVPVSSAPSRPAPARGSATTTRSARPRSRGYGPPSNVRWTRSTSRMPAPKATGRRDTRRPAAITDTSTLKGLNIRLQFNPPGHTGETELKTRSRPRPRRARR
jgi:chromosome partitioning protein